MFECMRCADCCGHWTIHVERWKANELLRRDWVLDRLRHYGLKLQPVDRETVQVPLKEDDYCVFLDAQKCCLIELHEGRTLKPDECKKFPFALGRCPDGSSAADASAYCKSVAERHLLEFLPVIPDDITAFGPEDQVTLPRRIRVRGRHTWERREYEQFRTALHQLFKQHADQPWQTLLRQLQAMLMERDGSGAEDAAFPHAGTERWLTRLFLRKPLRLRTLWRMLAYGEFSDHTVLPHPVPFKGVEAIRWPPAVNPWLAAYAHHMMQRQLLFGEGLAFSLHRLLSLTCIGCLLVQFYAKAFAWLDGHPAVEPANVTRAVRLVERSYTGHQPLFLAVVRHLPGGETMHRLLL